MSRPAVPPRIQVDVPAQPEAEAANPRPVGAGPEAALEPGSSGGTGHRLEDNAILVLYQADGLIISSLDVESLVSARTAGGRLAAEARVRLEMRQLDVTETDTDRILADVMGRLV